MALIRAVRIRVSASSVSAGARASFKEGLNVIRADNSRGKTQLTQAIAFALGVEGMFGPSRDVPLGSVLTDEFEISVAGETSVVPVVSSWCAIELENASGQVMVAQRFVKHPTIKPNLVRVWRVPVLTDPSARSAAEEFFVRERFAARHELGFHAELARFLGWDLPVVPRYTGEDALLYPEVIFPYLYVDQRAWGSSAPRAVTQFQLREPARRTFEFLLNMRGPEMAAERARLEASLTSLSSEWAAAVRSLEAISTVTGARVVGLPRTPAGATAHARGEVAASDLSGVSFEVLEAGSWIALPDAKASARRTLDEFAQTKPEAESVGTDRRELADRLRAVQASLAERTSAAAMLERETTLIEAQVDALDRRIASLIEERTRNQDVKTLVRLGGTSHRHGLGAHDCPTCHQSLLGVEAADPGPVMDIDDSLSLLNAELATAQAMRVEAIKALDSTRAAYDALARQIDVGRIEARSLAEDLVAPSDFPSTSAITARVAAELRLAELERAEDASGAILERLSELAIATAAARSALNALPIGIPPEDEAVIASVQGEMQVQLEEFGFSSYATTNVVLDGETLRPARPGFDLDADVSASDVVRLKIAYLNAIREVAIRGEDPQHPGLLVLDEPRQHEYDEVDFRSTLAHLARSDGGQVIVTTAAPTSSLASLLPDAATQVVADFSGRVVSLEADPDWLDL